MELILIRHGKAEERGSRKDDDRRVLIEEGRKKLQQTMPGLRLLLQKAEKVRIWSSRLDRAVQTAEILTQFYQAAEIEYFDCISSGDFNDLIAALKNVKANETVLLVGHEPHLGLWSEQLTGQTLPFKKGAAACFAIAGLEPPEAELVWFAQPLALSRIVRGIHE